MVLPYTTPFDIILTVFFRACLLLQNQILITSRSYPSRCARVVISLPATGREKEVDILVGVLGDGKISRGKRLNDRCRAELTGRMSVPVKVRVQQLKSLRREGGPPFPLLARLDPDEVRQMIDAALVPGIRCTTLAQIRKIRIDESSVNARARSPVWRFGLIHYRGEFAVPREAKRRCETRADAEKGRNKREKEEERERERG